MERAIVLLFGYLSFGAIRLIIFLLLMPVTGYLQPGNRLQVNIPAVMTLTMHDTTYSLSSNTLGHFPRAEGIRPGETVNITLRYISESFAGNVVVSVLDGGSLAGGKAVQVLTPNSDATVQFSFRVSEQPGIFRLLATNGSDKKVLKLWVNKTAEHAQRNNSHDDCPPCGNMSTICSPCLEIGAEGIDPSTSNVYRNMVDLEVWGGVGEIPLIAKRNASSRAVESVWRLDFYILGDGGVNIHGQRVIEFGYPQRWNTRFTESSTQPGKWLSPSNVSVQLFQYGELFVIQLENGHRHTFERVMIGGSASFVLREMKDQFQNVYPVTYDTAQRKKRITEPAGRYLEYTFSPQSFELDPVGVATSDGRSVTFVYDVVNDGVLDHKRLREAVYGDGTKALYNYSQQSPGLPFSLQHAIDPRGTGKVTDIKYTYINSQTIGLLHQEFNGKTDKVITTLDATTDNKKILYSNGRLQVYNMPEYLEGAINSYTDGVGATTIYEYYNGGVGFLKSSTDALGRKTTFDALTMYGNVLEKTNPDGSKEKWTRDTLDLVLTYTDELGRVTTYTRDSRHRPTRIDYPDGTFETFTYNTFSQVVSHQQKNGCTETFTYNGTGLKTGFADCLGNTTNYAYDAAGRVNQVTDARGNTTKYEYNERGLVTKVTNADNSLMTYTYDAFGNRLTTTNELGNTWTWTYDEFKRPVTMKDPLSRTTTYSYDLPGGVCGCSHNRNHPTAITLPSGKKTAYVYDVEWRLTSETTGAGTSDAATTSFQYDMVGNRVKTIDGRGNEWAMTYDSRNRNAGKTDPLGNTTQYTYDAVGNRVKETRPDAGTTTVVYDALNRPTSQTDAKGQATTFEYDAEGNMLKLTDANSNAYTFTYDNLDRKTKMTYPGGSFEAYSYDAVGNMVTYTNRKGDVRTYTYDSRNRETLSNWSDATPGVSTTYDDAGRVLTKNSSASALSFTYDDANQMLTETQHVAGAPARTTGYSYNTDGLRNELTYPGGTNIAYSYTQRNQLAAIHQGLTAVVQYAYDANDNRSNKTLANGTNTAFTYDAANRVLEVNHLKGAASFAKFNYGYDNVSRRTYQQYNDQKGDVYSYDAIDQVTGVLYDVTNPDGTPGTPARTVNYDYDPLGNRNTVTDNLVSTVYTTNHLNQYTTVGANAATYNGNGSLATFDGWTYTYDAQERMTRAEKGATVTTFSYDGLNRCVQRTTNGNALFLYYDGWSLLEERNNTGTVINLYIHGPVIDEIVTKTSATETVYYHYDALGSVMRLTDNTGVVAEQYSYDVFGEPVIKNSAGTVLSSTAYANRFLFTGREYLETLGLYDYRNRVYSLILGRFLQVDPLTIYSENNNYTYAGNSSVSYLDPVGLYKCENIGDIGNSRFLGVGRFVYNVNPGLDGKTYTSLQLTVLYQCCECITQSAVQWSNIQESELYYVLNPRSGKPEFEQIGSGPIELYAYYKYSIKIEYEENKYNFFKPNIPFIYSTLKSIYDTLGNCNPEDPPIASTPTLVDVIKGKF